jgi:serine/threonine protein kinase
LLDYCEVGEFYEFCKIGDLGLSRSANDTSKNNEIYGVIPYIAPEIFKGSAFSKESDIYSLGGPRTIHEKVTIQSLRRMYPKSCRSLPFLDNSDQHYIVPALKRCVELLVNLCRSIVTYLYIARGPSLGMIMWELTTGCKPFANVEHDHSLIYNIIDGVRPEITEDTPQCYADLMKRCWDPDPEKRPSVDEFYMEFIHWRDSTRVNFINQIDVTETTNNQFVQAEFKRKKLIESKKLGPKFNEKSHPKAIYTSRSLNSYISKYSSINFSSNGMYYYTILIKSHL